MRECEFKNFTTDFRNNLDRLLKLYKVKNLTPRQKYKLSILFYSRLPEKRSTLNGKKFKFPIDN